MKEKDIKDLLEAAKVVNHFRSLASTFVCPVCGEPLEGDIDTVSLTSIIPYGRIYCPHCKLFRAEGRKEILIKASTGVVALVESYTHLT